MLIGRSSDIGNLHAWNIKTYWCMTICFYGKPNCVLTMAPIDVSENGGYPQACSIRSSSYNDFTSRWLGNSK